MNFGFMWMFLNLGLRKTEFRDMAKGMEKVNKVDWVACQMLGGICQVL